jgi:hexosaminidase
MTRFFRIGGHLVLLSILILTSCKKDDSVSRASILIPKPSSIVAGKEVFTLENTTSIYVSQGNKEVFFIANYLAAKLRLASGFPLAVAADAPPENNFISLNLVSDASLGEEGYQLTVNEASVKLLANKPAGLFYGIQTLRQLLPAQIESSALQKDIEWKIPEVSIKDVPAYSWRGSMLDVARHFFSVEDVKKYIDYMALYKMNVLHLSLSNDQGWRIEIKSWPNLAIHGGSTQVGGGKGGYYTQEQYKDIVAYAQKQYITIVPEIDLPGHINAALASYGELNGGITLVPEKGRINLSTNAGEVGGKNKPTELYTGIEVGFSTLQYNQEATFRFVNDVIKELSSITPGEYIHIGGDEARVTKKEEYIKFVNKFYEIVTANGKKMIGWEEISQADIKGDIIAQHWDSPSYPKMAVEKGGKILMSPAPKVYLDMQYDSTSKLGLHWAAYIEVKDSYDWEPTSLVEGITKENIIGVETPLWTETISTMKEIEYMLFPRFPGIAEIAWSKPEGRNWEEYKVRLAAHGKRFDVMGINYYKSKQVPWEIVK